MAYRLAIVAYLRAFFWGKAKIALSAFICITAIPLPGQSERTGMPEEATEIVTLVSKGRAQLRGRQDSALVYADLALTKARRSGRLDWCVQPQLLKGDYFMDRGRVDSASHYYQAAYETAGAEGLDSLSAIVSLAYAGALLKQSQVERASQILSEAIIYFEKYDRADQLALAHRTLASIKFNMGNQAESRAYAYRAVEYAKQSGQAKILSLTYRRLAYNIMQDTRLDSAYAYATQAIEYALADGDERLIGPGYGMRAIIQNYQANYQGALDDFDRVLELEEITRPFLR